MTSNSIRSIMNSPMAMEVATHWKTFINGGITFNFLKEMIQLRLVLDNNKSSNENADFGKFSEGGIRLLMEDSTLPYAKSKIVLGCLTAIKGAHYRPDAKIVVDRILAASKSAGIADVDATHENDVAKAFRNLISANLTITDFEALLHKDVVDREHVALLAHSTTTEEYIMLASNFKLVADLTYKSIETFPFLLNVHVEQQEIMKFIDEMIKDDIVSYAIRAVVYFPDRIDLAYFHSMQRTLTEGDKFWDLFGDILVFVSRLRTKCQDMSAFSTFDDISENLEADESDEQPQVTKSSASSKNGNPRNQSSGISILQDDSKSQKRILKALVQAIRLRRQQTTSTSTSSSSLIDVSDDEFNAHILQFIQFCMQSSTTLSFRAGINVAERLNRYDILPEIKLQALTKHYTGLVEKDRWRVALMGASTMERKTLLYEILIKNGKYQEAKMLYDEEQLQCHVRPVDSKYIQQQLQQQASLYLPFPHEKVRVMMVDSLESLQYMTEVIGIPFLEDDLNSNNSSSSSTGKRSSRFVQVKTLQDAFSNGLIAMKHSIAMTEVITNTTTVTTDKQEGIEYTTETTSAYQSIQSTDKEVEFETYQDHSMTSNSETKSLHTNKRSHATNDASLMMTTPDRKQASTKEPKSAGSGSKHKKANTANDSPSLLPPQSPSIQTVTDDTGNSKSIPQSPSSSSKESSVVPITTMIQNIIGLDTEWDVAVQDALLSSIRSAKQQQQPPSQGSSSRSMKQSRRIPTTTSPLTNSSNLAQMTGDEGGADILQIATVDHAFIVDLYAIGNNIYHRSEAEADRLEKLTAQIIGRIFLDNSILKVAFDFYNEDMKKLSQVGRKGHFSQSIQGISNLLDISRTADKTAKDAKVYSSLSSACEHFLGKPLNKAERLSPWTHRPLSLPQLHYASLDAHCLIGITDALLLEESIDIKINVASNLYPSRK